METFEIKYLNLLNNHIKLISHEREHLLTFASSLARPKFFGIAQAQEVR